MVTTDKHALAIEAKWTEPRYETMAKRLRRANSNADDSRAFIEGWLEFLQPFATTPLHLDDFSETVYQVVHRSASACSLGLQPVLAYLHFSTPTPTGGATCTQYIRDLTAVHELLGSPDRFPFFVIDLPLEPTPAFLEIQGLKKGQATTGQAVRSALRAGVLFKFGEPRVHRVGAPPV
jgi:hypothetical protein